MKQTRSLSEFSCLSEYTRLYPSYNSEISFLGSGSIILFQKANNKGVYHPGLCLCSLHTTKSGFLESRPISISLPICEVCPHDSYNVKSPLSLVYTIFYF